jgi:hypothetical protein
LGPAEAYPADLTWPDLRHSPRPIRLPKNEPAIKPGHSRGSYCKYPSLLIKITSAAKASAPVALPPQDCREWLSRMETPPSALGCSVAAEV